MSDKLFFSNIYEDEIFRSMESSLVKNQTEKTHGLNKLALAVDYLNDAAGIFEQAGMTLEAFDIVQIITSLTKGLE